MSFGNIIATAIWDEVFAFKINASSSRDENKAEVLTTIFRHEIIEEMAAIIERELTSAAGKP